MCRIQTQISRMRSLNACADGMLIPDGVLYGVKGSETEEDREVDVGDGTPSMSLSLYLCCDLTLVDD
jgi:hypothetical protein